MVDKVNYAAHGRIFGRNIQTILGRLLYEERWKRRLTLVKAGSMVPMKPEKIEDVELGRCKMHWGQIKKLLDFYGKQVVINLIEVEKKPKE